MTAAERRKQVNEAVALLRRASTLLLGLGPNDPDFNTGLAIDAEARELAKGTVPQRKRRTP